MSVLRAEALTKRFGNTTAVQDVSCDVQDGEMFVVLGHSGSGKTTTLRLIAGLETPDSGDVFFDEKRATDQPANQRDIAFMFQSPALLPNRTVSQNIAYPLLCQDRSWLGLLLCRLSKDHTETVKQWASRLSITSLLQRYPATLSGGESQRVALARALAKGSRILLLDEPLGNVDVRLRDTLRKEFLNVRNLMRKNGGGAIVYVTHDQLDALMLADRMAVMKEGQIMQIGSPQQIYNDPQNLFTAIFVGIPEINVVPGSIRLQTNSATIDLLSGLIEVELQGTQWRTVCEDRQTVHVAIRPDKIQLANEGQGNARLLARHDLGDHHHLILGIGDHELRATCVQRPSLQVGQSVVFSVESTDLMVFDVETEQRIL